MKKIALVTVAAVAMVFAGSSNASADTDTGSLTVTGSIQSSIGFTIESAGGTVTGAGTGTASSALGNVAKFDVAAPTGFTATASSRANLRRAPRR